VASIGAIDLRIPFSWDVVQIQRCVRDRLTFDQCFGNLDCFLLGERKIQAETLELYRSFNIHAPRQVFANLNQFERLKDLFIGMYWDPLYYGFPFYKYFEKNLYKYFKFDEACAQAVASSTTLRKIDFEKCDCDDASWMNLCRAVATSNSALKYVVMQSFSIPGWLQFSSKKSKSKITERTQQMADAVNECMSRHPIELYTRGEDDMLYGRNNGDIGAFNMLLFEKLLRRLSKKKRDAVFEDAVDGDKEVEDESAK
jgi:hypothetical protein